MTRYRDWRLHDLAEMQPRTDIDALPLVIQTDHIHQQNDLEMTHRHLDFAALMIVRRGRGRHLLNGTAYGISRGDVYVMGQGTAHQWEEFEDLVIVSLYFSPQVFDAATLTALQETPGFLPLFVEEPLRHGAGGDGERWLHLTPDEHARIESEIAETTAEWKAGTPLGRLLARGLLLRLLAHLALIYTERQAHLMSPSLAGGRPSGVRAATVAAALSYMEAHFTEAITIEEVAAAMFLSPAHFREVFAQVMGRAPRDYLRLLRVERARTLLATTDSPVTEIGLASGLGEAAYFARVFRAETGMTPREYRRLKMESEEASLS